MSSKPTLPDTEIGVRARAYLENLRLKNYSESTIRYEMVYLRQFISWLEERSITSPQEVTRGLLERYRSQLHMYPLTEGTVKTDQMFYEEVIEKLSARDLVKLVQELPLRYRMVFNLYAIEGYTHKEIAEMMGITVGTSKSNLSRARDILQRKVNKYFESSEHISKKGERK